jgi:hypothetical protein
MLSSGPGSAEASSANQVASHSPRALDVVVNYRDAALFSNCSATSLGAPFPNWKVDMQALIHEAISLVIEVLKIGVYLYPSNVARFH